jgi:hypothetical protein
MFAYSALVICSKNVSSGSVSKSLINGTRTVLLAALAGIVMVRSGIGSKSIPDSALPPNVSMANVTCLVRSPVREMVNSA